jgi:Fe2+ or Zn2+ uptake regulation protein
MPPAHPTAPEKFALALRTLRQHQQRVTAPRRAVLSVLTHRHGPFTADEIHRRISKGVCDLVTVYRCLTTMEEINLVRRCDFGDGSYRYEFNTGEHHHHHIICRVCHRVKTLEYCVAETLERMARKMGYANVTHTLEIFGVCGGCSRAAGARG